jgi:alpha-glucosidase
MSQTLWYHGVIYQIYPRSFYDTTGNGVGDLRGIFEKLPYIASLGVDAVWISPFFKSSMKDFGYDVSDYCAPDPLFGTLDDVQTVIDRAHELGLKIMFDMVWAHTSDQHPWFVESRSNKDNDKSDWYIWRDAKPDGTAPNNWLSYFGGPAWTWDSRREQYYLHQFLTSQPQLNFWNDNVKQAAFDTARFWLDRGVDGFRLDVAHAYLVDKDLRDNPARTSGATSDIPSSNPMSRQVRLYNANIPENMNVIRDIRALMNEYDNRCALAEAGGEDSEAVAASYANGDDKLHLAYSFGLVGSRMTAPVVRGVIEKIESVIDAGRICNATSNHDFKRAISRYTDNEMHFDSVARLNMALGLTLRGSYCLYQGEELGLPQAELSFDQLQDPYDKMLYPLHVGRDGCRTPMVWNHDKSHGGFTSSDTPWLPVPDVHHSRAVDVQETQQNSVLNAYKRFLNFRKHSDILLKGSIKIIYADDNMLVYERTLNDKKIICVFNISDKQNSYVLNDTCKLRDDLSHGVTQLGAQISFAPYAAGIFESK